MVFKECDFVAVAGMVPNHSRIIFIFIFFCLFGLFPNFSPPYLNEGIPPSHFPLDSIYVASISVVLNFPSPFNLPLTGQIFISQP